MEQKMDALLRVIQQKESYTWFQDNQLQKIGVSPGSEVFLILHQLHKDGYILSPVENTSITAKGLMFLESGGYTEKSKKERLAHQASLSQAKFSKWGFGIAIVAIVVAIASLALQFIEMK